MRPPVYPDFWNKLFSHFDNQSAVWVVEEFAGDASEKGSGVHCSWIRECVRKVKLFLHFSSAIRARELAVEGFKR